MSWNYRVVEVELGDTIGYGMYEVFYDNDGNPEGITEHPIDFFSDNSLEDLNEAMNAAMGAFSKPVLKMNMFTTMPVSKHGKREWRK